MVELDKTKLPKAEVTSLTVMMKSRTQVINKKGRFYVANHKFVDPIPIIIMMKALGVVSEQQIVSFVGAEPRILEALGPSLADCAGSEIMSEEQALIYVANKLQPSRYYRSRSSEYRHPVDNARDVLCKVVLPHVRTDRYFNFRRKAIYLGNMVRRMVLVEEEPRLLCDRDYYGNKRIEL